MGDIQQLTIAADVKNLSAIRQFVEGAAEHFQVSAGAAADMVQAVDEAATNIIMHAYHRGPGVIDIATWREEGHWLVRLRDHGPPFDPTQVPPPDISVPLEKRRLGGLGIHLMRQFTDKMIYQTTPEGANELILLKHTIAREPGAKL